MHQEESIKETAKLPILGENDKICLLVGCFKNIKFRNFIKITLLRICNLVSIQNLKKKGFAFWRKIFQQGILKK